LSSPPLYNTEKINNITAAEIKIINKVVNVLLIMCSISIISQTAKMEIIVKNKAKTASNIEIPFLNIILIFSWPNITINEIG